MATSQSTAEYILDQISLAGKGSIRKMFGEYCLYCDGKVVGFICDEQLFVKPTEAGKAYLGDYKMAAFYTGGSEHLLITGDRWDDREWLSGLIRLTADALPVPKPKKKKG